MKKFTFAFLLYLLASCSTKPQHTVRYKKIKIENEPREKQKLIENPVSVWVKIFDEPPKDDQLRTLFDLQGEGQAQFIRSVHEIALQDTVVLEAGNFIKNIGAPLTPSHKNIEFKRLARLTLKFIISIDNKVDRLGGTHMADRIENITVSIFNNNKENINIEFLELNNLETQEEYISLGNVKYVQTKGKENEIEVGFSQQSAGAKLKSKHSSNKQLEEKIDYEERIITTSVFAHGGKLRLYQEGAPRRDLDGNVIIEAKVLIEDLRGNKERKTKKHFVFSNLFTEDNESVPPENIHLKVIEGIPTDACFQMKFEYLYRKVTNKKGQRTVGEDDDVAVYRFVEVPPYRKREKGDSIINPCLCDTLNQKNSFRVKFPDELWLKDAHVIVFSDTAGVRHTLKYQMQYDNDSDENKPENIRFRTYNDARAFWYWLHGITIPKDEQTLSKRNRNKSVKEETNQLNDTIKILNMPVDIYLYLEDCPLTYQKLKAYKAAAKVKPGISRGNKSKHTPAFVIEREKNELGKNEK